jgi:hypothetical protein
VEAIIMRSSIRTFGALSGAAAALVLALSSPALAKRVICIDGAGGGMDPAINIKEGYERALGITSPPDVVSIGGALTDCLAMVANDDELVIIAHGGPGTFDWGGMTYTGFGMGPGLMPVPPGFGALTGVHARFCACFSANDPKGADTSVTSKLLEAMGGAGGTGNTVGGFQAEAGPGVIPVLCGGTAQQQMMAGDALNNMLAMWTAFPPANRPGTGGPGQPPNQQTAAQQKVDQVVGPGVIVVKIPNQVGMFTDPPAPNVGGYVMPTDGGNLAARSGIFPPVCMGCACLFFGWVDGGPLSAIPTLSEWGLLSLAGVFVLGGAFMLRRTIAPV